MASHLAAAVTARSATDAGAFLARLFEEHGRMIYGLCRLLLRDPVEAEDAAQEAFLSAQRSLVSGTDPRDARAWLAEIARNECRARIRERMRAPLGLVDDSLAHGRDAAQVAGERAEARALCEGLAALPPQQRDAFVLREFYGLSYEEAAAALGVTHANFETLLHRGRGRLQEHLRPVRLAQGALVVPLGLHEALAASVPGFAGGSSAAAGAGVGAFGGWVAQLGGTPVAAKVAAVAAAASMATTGVAVSPAGPRIAHMVAPPGPAVAMTVERKRTISSSRNAETSSRAFQLPAVAVPEPWGPDRQAAPEPNWWWAPPEEEQAAEPIYEEPGWEVAEQWSEEPVEPAQSEEWSWNTRPSEEEQLPAEEAPPSDEPAPPADEQIPPSEEPPAELS